MTQPDMPFRADDFFIEGYGTSVQDSEQAASIANAKIREWARCPARVNPDDGHYGDYGTECLYCSKLLAMIALGE